MKWKQIRKKKILQSKKLLISLIKLYHKYYSRKLGKMINFQLRLRMINLSKKIIKKYYFILLVVIVLISYGQILWMQPWQDDNALMFKLNHIEDAAGFLGKGLIG